LVSARHALLNVDRGGRVTVTDLHSHLGTFVNGRVVAEPSLIGRDDTVDLGRTRLAIDVRGPARNPADRATSGELVDGRTTFWRPPRGVEARAGEPLVPPGPVPATPAAPRLPWPAILAPLVMGLAFAVLVAPVM